MDKINSTRILGWNRRKGIMTISQYHQRLASPAMERTHFPDETVFFTKMGGERQNAPEISGQ